MLGPGIMKKNVRLAPLAHQTSLSGERDGPLEKSLRPNEMSAVVRTCNECHEKREGGVRG